MGITLIEGIVTGPTGHQATVQLLVNSGATYTLLPYGVWRAIGLSPKRLVPFSPALCSRCGCCSFDDSAEGMDGSSRAAHPQAHRLHVKRLWEQVHRLHLDQLISAGLQEFYVTGQRRRIA